MIKGNRYLLILSCLHFADNRNETDRKDENFDSLWMIQDVFEIQNGTFSKFYNNFKNLAMDEIIVSFKVGVVFKQYIPKKMKNFGIKIFKLCDSNGYAYDMKVYLGKDGQHTAQHITATHATVTELIMNINTGHGPSCHLNRDVKGLKANVTAPHSWIFCND
jgi:hypothetical protein